MGTRIHQQMVFNNKEGMIYPFLKDAVSFIKTHLPDKTAQLVFKTKMIITELLTNSIKHANDDFTLIEFMVNDHEFIIRRTDIGLPFYLKNPDDEQELLEWPLNDVEGPIEIYSDHLNGLFANITSPYSLSFYAECYPDEMIVFPDISEHYGLTIICRASDDFVYEHDPQSRRNTFTITINLS